MIPLSFIPLPYRIAAVIVVAVLIGAFGYQRGVKSMAGDLAACHSTVELMKGHSDELKRQAEADRVEFERIQKQTADDWADALDWVRGNPRVIRLRQPCRSEGTVPEAATPAAGAEGAAGEPRLGAPGTAAVELSLEEITERLNRAELDAARLAHIIARDEEMTRKGLLQ